MRFIHITLLFALGAALQVSCQQTDSVTQLRVDELREMMEEEKDFVLLDVRTPEEIDETGTIGNAVVIDYLGQEFEEKVLKLEKDKTWVVYCASGGRSNAAARIMLENGFDKVMNLEGGYNAWEEE